MKDLVIVLKCVIKIIIWTSPIMVFYPFYAMIREQIEEDRRICGPNVPNRFEIEREGYDMEYRASTDKVISSFFK